MIDNHRETVPGSLSDPFPPDQPLLLPKLQIPRLQSSLVLRSRLLAHLDAGLERKLCLISAPAGFGKTTLVCQWIAGRSAQAHPPQVSWLSLDEGDNDPFRFWRYLILACRIFDRNVGSSSLPVLEAASNSGLHSWHANLAQPSSQALLDSFLHEISLISTPSVLVLEDYHLITTPSIHEAVTKLLEHLPASLHLCLLTRSDPPLPLAKLRLRDDLVELHAVDLSFSHEETREFLQKSIQHAVPEEVVSRLETRTEGWGAGMRLLVLALQRKDSQPQIDEFLASYSGSYRHLLEFFITEVLEVQPESVQDFLLRTSLLARLTGPLCDAITGRDDSRRLLKRLERAGLFLQPLDDSGEWYRYHALFAEAARHEARSRLGGEVISHCYLQASGWYEQNGMLPEAVDASLAAGEFPQAARLIERLAEMPDRHERQGLFTLQRWLEMLPGAVLRAHPALCFLYANALVFLSITNRLPQEKLKRVEEVLQMAEEGWKAVENLPGLGEVFAFHALLAFRQGESLRASDLARRSLGWLPAGVEYASSRVICLSLMGHEKLQNGDFEPARQKFLEALALTEASGNIPGKRVMLQSLGELCLGRGELDRAAGYFRLVLSLAGEDITDRVNALLGLARASYERNDLEGVEKASDEILQTASQYSDEILHGRSSLLVARLLRARGQVQEARDLLQDLFTQLEASGPAHLSREVMASLVDLRLTLGEIAGARRWLADQDRRDDAIPYLLRGTEALLTARAWTLLGEYEKSLQVLDEWMEIAHRMDHPGMILNILLLKSLCFRASGQPQGAKALILQALPMAQGEGYRRLFLDHGAPAMSVLRSVISEVRHPPLLTYLRSLLDAFASAPGEPASPEAESALVELFSSQELRVFRLLEAGFSRQEIARELVLSPNTVKSHILHIYQKLSVTSRSEAIEAARNLKQIRSP